MQIQKYKYTNTNTQIQIHTHNIKVSPKWLQILIVSANQSIVLEWWKILKGLWLQLVNKKSSSFFVRHKKNTRAGLGGGFLQSGLESSRIVNIMTKCEHWSPRLCSFLFVCFGAGSSWNHPKGKITGARTPIAKVWFETKEMIRTAFQAKKHFWTERIYVNKEAFQEKGHFLKFKISAACDWVEISPKPFLPCISCKPPIIWRDISKNNFASVKNRLAMFFPVVGWKDNRQAQQDGAVAAK